MDFFLRVKEGAELKYSGFIQLDETVDVNSDLSESVLLNLQALTHGAFSLWEKVYMTGVMELNKENHFTMEGDGVKTNASFSLYSIPKVDLNNLVVMVQKREVGMDLCIDTDWDVAPMLFGGSGLDEETYNIMVFEKGDTSGLRFKYPSLKAVSLLELAYGK